MFIRRSAIFRRTNISPILMCAFALAAGCGSSSSGDSANNGDGDGGANGSNGTNGTNGDGGSNANGGDGGSGGNNGTAPPPNTSSLGTVFAHGINCGYWPNFTDPQTSNLSAMAGSDSLRVSLPEAFLVQWGYGIATDSMKARDTYGMGLYDALLETPTTDHSTAPSGGDADFYIPKNLYEPIFDTTGAVNANNYFAAYVYQTMQTYGQWIKVYSVWNEPDWVSDYNIALGWSTKAPQVSDLPRFNGSIFDYARMLRIAKTVAAKVSPDIRVATGGLGYPTFLDALSRYTDNPTDGTVTADYPSTGITYADVLDLHYYPLYTPGNSDAAVNGLIAHRDSFNAVLTAAKLPLRPVIYTETGAPHIQVGTNPGSPEYARNYYAKAMVKAQAAGISAVHWFLLSDSTASATDPYGSMGLYTNLSSVNTVAAATKTDTGVASTTLGTLLKGKVYDATSTAALPATPNVTGAVFQDATTHKRTLVAWATSTTANEDGSASYALPFAANEIHWDYATTQTTVNHASGASVTLASDPRYFVEP